MATVQYRGGEAFVWIGDTCFPVRGFTITTTMRIDEPSQMYRFDSQSWHYDKWPLEIEVSGQVWISPLLGYALRRQQLHVPALLASPEERMKRINKEVGVLLEGDWNQERYEELSRQFDDALHRYTIHHGGGFNA